MLVHLRLYGIGMNSKVDVIWINTSEIGEVAGNSAYLLIELWLIEVDRLLWFAMKFEKLGKEEGRTKDRIYHSTIISYSRVLTFLEVDIGYALTRQK